MTRKIGLLGAFLVVFCSAGFASDYQSPRTAALGGAGHAFPILTDSIYMNPAFGSFMPAYMIGASYNGYHGPDDTEPKGRVFNVSAVDGTNELFQAGAGYTRRADGRFVHIGASKKIINQLGVGIGSKFAFGSDSRQSANDYSVSTLFNILPWVQASLMADNLIQSDKGKAWNLYREITLGTRFNVISILMVYFDPHLTPDKPTGKTLGYEAGAELSIFQDLFFRVGMNRASNQPHVDAYGHGYGWGLGWVAPKIALDFAIYRSVEPIETRNMLFSATISF